MSVVEQITNDSDELFACASLERFAEVYDSPTPEQAMAQACSNLRRRVGEVRPPFGLRSLLNAFRARLVERPIKSPGRLEIEDNHYIVVVKKGNHWRRQRFTIAHEIGHILLLEAIGDDAELLSELRRDKYWPQLERLCNFAAAEILVPRDDLVTSVSEQSYDSNVIMVLYDRYLCSMSTLFIRLVNVFDGLSVSLWREHARHRREEKRLRVMQCFGSNKRTWIPDGMTGKHLMPNIVHLASNSGVAHSTDVLFTLSSRKRNLVGLANKIAPLRGNDAFNSKPLFQGMQVPDETFQDSTIALLLWPKYGSNIDPTKLRSLAHLASGFRPSASNGTKSN